MMWNYALSSLLCGASLCIYNGAVNYPNQNVLWNFATKAKINHFGHGASYYQALFKNTSFSLKTSELALKTLGSTGSPLDAATTVKLQNTFSKTHIISLSGGTDVCTAFVGGHLELDVKPGEIQCKMLGAPVSIYDENAKKVIDSPGELVLEGPFIALPKALWGDEDFSQYKKSYYSMFDNVWNHGDWATETKSGGFIIHGRSDATLNRSGIRIGTAEFYALFDKRKDIEDSLIIHLSKEGEDALYLFLKGNSKIDFNELKKSIRKNCSPRHVPDYIHLVPDIPYTISGKKVEIPIKKLLSGISLDKALSKESLRNPKALEWFTEFALKDSSFSH
jgi:acetoacetyl-CoA synthetase